ncbi:hypothetical protein KC853_01080 [Candidatus Saccharibacteria bacterium]|nr:hypothetical protein [Candidatus Saccharibacteria bacterium]MCB9834437.1 hypothetical protein [Candidatus Nomurabacteria bacterium]
MARVKQGKLLKKVAIDTNVLVRLVVGDVKYQQEIAINLVNSCHQVYIADLAIAETVFVLERYYQMPRIAIKQLFGKLSLNPKLRLQSSILLLSLGYLSKIVCLQHKPN